ncbi:transposase IS3/IS911 [Nitrobacter hamburgensis X14]|uniref:Transposase IS3/IS911 n=1 Tax=Nitrobacter hamburgensis (strain DSM 10229 / NCIMB 13809 / X14) TaxID=323097 RepID=Q1QJ44_NITHX|nr:transposase IS3/IS911 [Nitrobacter hamburgensis X14]
MSPSAETLIPDFPNRLLEVVETGRRRRWSDEEKLRIVLESLETPRAISSTARRHGISRSLLMTRRRVFRHEPTVPDVQQTGFARAMVATAETVAAEPGAPASGRMVIEIGKERRVIVDAGVDAAALERVLRIYRQ